MSGFNPTQNDLTELVQKWVDGTVPNHGIEISIPEWESASFKAKYFFQKEWSASLGADLEVTYSEPCTAPLAPSSPSPAAGSEDQPSPVILDWADSAGASSYDLYFGESATPPFRELSTVSTAEVPGLAPATTYFWRVEARATCDTGVTSTSPTWSFTTSVCLDPASPGLLLPVAEAIGQPRSVDLSWDPVTAAGQYEVYLGTTNPPTDLLTTTGGTGAQATVEAATRYFWKVRAIAACDPSRTAESPVRLFDTALAPAADAGPDQSAPGGTPLVLGGTPAATGGLDPYTYNWTVRPDSGTSLSSSTAPNPTLTAVSPGNRSAQLVVTDSNGFSSLPSSALIVVPCHALNLVLSGETITGAVEYVACGALSIGTSSVASGGELSLSAGQSVALSSGFSVESGGTLNVRIDPSLVP